MLHHHCRLAVADPTVALAPPAASSTVEAQWAVGLLSALGSTVKRINPSRRQKIAEVLPIPNVK
jgi:hypothetical protein